MGELSANFNRMTKDLEKYVEDTIQRQKDINDVTLKLYQTQLNPHFLYNTLDSIRWDAKINKNQKIAVLAENLATILRKTISEKPFVTLEEELEIIESYVKIQEIRFSGSFLYETEIPDFLMDCIVPKMILQPLVENAIIHGLDGYEDSYLCIYAFQDGETLHISVTDNGCGMPDDMIKWLNDKNLQKKEGHLGLYNVIQILKIYYGQEYGARVSSDAEGTTVTLMLPIQREVKNV